MNWVKHIASATALAMGASSSVGHSQQLTENVLVTGAYVPAQEVTSSSSVLDAEEIARLNKRNVADLLQTMPGLLVEKQGGPGGLVAVSVRGGEANFTLVLLDGVPVNDPTNFRGGGFDFADLDANLVERIEVVRGALSAVYGSDALAGVINIVTRRPEAGHNQQVFAQLGEDDLAQVGVILQGAGSALDYTLEVATRDDGEPIEGSTRETDTANLRIGWRLADAHRLEVSARLLEGRRSSYPEQSGGPQYAVSDALDTSRYKQEVWSLGWKADFTDRWQSELAASRFDREDDYASPGIPPFLDVPPNAADTQFTRDLLQWTNTIDLAENYRVVAGAQYREEQGESKGYVEFFGSQVPTDFELDRATGAVFVSGKAKPLPALLLQGSVRHDNPEDFDSELTFQTGVRYTLNSAFDMYANWGEAYKLPSFFALGHALVGNPELQPEEAQGWDVGINYQSSAALRLGLTWFFNDFQNLIDFDEETFRNVNRKSVETSGLELQGSWQVLETLQLRGQLTYTDIDVKEESTVLTGRPEWTAGLIASWQPAADWDGAVEYRYGGEQWAVSRQTGMEMIQELDDYHRVDATMSWRPVNRWLLQLSIDNLFDKNYETAVGLPTQGRAFRIGVRWQN